MCVHMAGLMRDSVRPWGVSSSRSGEGSSVARAAVSHNISQYRQHTVQSMSELQHNTTPVYLAIMQDRAEGIATQLSKATNWNETHDARNTTIIHKAHTAQWHMWPSCGARQRGSCQDKTGSKTKGKTGLQDGRDKRDALNIHIHNAKGTHNATDTQTEHYLGQQARP